MIYVVLELHRSAAIAAIAFWHALSRLGVSYGAPRAGVSAASWTGRTGPRRVLGLAEPPTAWPGRSWHLQRAMAALPSKKSAFGALV